MSITKVAELAGVSSSTVSRVINNHPRVAPETAEAVRRAMATLAYTPSDRRPGPKPQSRQRVVAGNVTFLVFGTSRRSATPAFADLLRGVSEAASQRGLSLSFAHVSDPEQLPSRLIDGVDGLLLHGAAPPPAVRDQLRRIPTVWLMGNRRRPDWGDQVMPDGYEIGHLASRYLLSRGHRRLAYLNLDVDHWPFQGYGHAFSASATEAGASVEQVLEKRDTPADYWQPYHQESVDRLVTRFRQLKPAPTGAFVADDIQVALIQPALRNQGVTLGPDGVELITCNNEEPYLMGLTPRPAVIDIRVRSIGQRGVEQLLWRIAHPDVRERICTTIEPYVITPEQAEKATA